MQIQEGRRDFQFQSKSQASGRGLLGGGSTKLANSTTSSEAIGSTLGGNTIVLDAKRDISIKGSTLIADNNISLLADRDISITAAQNTSSSEAFKEVKKSGLMGSGGFGVFIGSKQQSTDQKQQNVTNTGSTIGSIGGDVTLIAGNTAKVQGSAILTPSVGGDITIIGKT
ncbi:MAG: hypothetical protein HC765_16095, partial [Brachymonas sp.]|nr:hypothetical protein [Brachymonas sp.]